MAEAETETDQASMERMLQQAGFTTAPQSVEDERRLRKQKLAATFRIFGRFGFDEGVAGHVTVRDPQQTDHFWVNPFGVSFKQIKVSDLILVNHQGEVVEGDVVGQAPEKRLDGFFRRIASILSRPPNKFTFNFD